MQSAPLHFQDEQAEVHKVVVGPLDNNVFVLRCRDTGEAVLIDAADEADQLLRMCRSLGVGRVLETHGHHDHIQAVPALREAGYEVGVSAEDAPMLASHDFTIADDAVLDVGRLRLRALFTPGHTPGSMSFLVEGSAVLFGGDTLFPGGPGKTTNPGGHFPTIIRSIEERIFSRLDPGTIVMPGHGEDTTVGAEQPHLQEWVERGW